MTYAMNQRFGRCRGYVGGQRAGREWGHSVAGSLLLLLFVLLGMGGNLQAQYVDAEDPVGDCGGYPSWIDIVKTDLSLTDDGLFVFGIEVAAPVPENPGNYVGYVWGIDADCNWSTPFGYSINDIETEYHVRLAYDGGWFGVIDRLDQADVDWAEGYSFSEGRTRLEVTVDPADLDFSDSLYFVSGIAWPGSGPERAPNTGHVTYTGVKGYPVDISPGECPNRVVYQCWDVEPQDTTIIRGSLGRGVPEIEDLDKPMLEVAILGTDTKDVSEIMPSSVALAGVSSFAWRFEDVSTPVGPDADDCDCTDAGPDGYLDMVFEFPCASLLRTLAVSADGEMIPLALSGMTQTGRSIGGTDCILLEVYEMVYPGSDGSTGGSSLTNASNYPNPFNPSTTIRFESPDATDYRLTVYNTLGQVVKRFQGIAHPGENEVVWDASSSSSGVYFYKLEIGNNTDTKKMMLLK